MNVAEDTFKGTFHAIVGTLVAIMAAYNGMRWCATRGRRNAINLIIYLPLVCYEFQQAQYHWSQGENT